MTAYHVRQRHSLSLSPTGLRITTGPAREVVMKLEVDCQATKLKAP